MDVCECDKSAEQQQVDALLSSTLVIEREVQNLGVLISHPIPLRHLRELASKLEVLSDMLRYYSEKVYDFRPDSWPTRQPAREFDMSFVLRSCQAEARREVERQLERHQDPQSTSHPTTQQVYDNRQVGLERSLRHHEREQHGGAPCTCPTDDMAEDEIDCP